ncbi:hypothetical protein TWF281_004629 [Arthrobotrys megalospora]
MVPPAIIPIFEGYLSVGRFQEIRFQLGTHILTRSVNYNVDICDDVLSGLNHVDLNPEVLSVVFCSSEGQVEDIADTISGFIYIEEMGLDEREVTLQDWMFEKGVLVSTFPLPTELHISNVVFLGMPSSLMDWVQVKAERSTIICRMPSNEANDQESLWAIHSRKALYDTVTTTQCRRAIINSFIDGTNDGDCIMLGASLCDNCMREPTHPFPVALPDQTTRILDYLEEAGNYCSYCFFLGRLTYHRVKDCRAYEPEKKIIFHKVGCRSCGVPKGHCPGRACPRAATCRAIYQAAFEDSTISGRLSIELSGELGIGRRKWLEGSKGQYSNAWRLLQILDKLQLLSFK